MRAIVELGEKVLARTYARYPVAFARGEGVWLYDVNGRKYLDFLSGLSPAGWHLTNSNHLR